MLVALMPPDDAFRVWLIPSTSTCAARSFRQSPAGQAQSAYL